MESKLSDREIVLPAETLTALGDALRETGGGGAALRVLRTVGRAAGELGVDGLGGKDDSAPRELVDSVFWNRLSGYLARRGWGTLRQSAPHPGVGLIETSDWADQAHGSPFSEGLLSGFLSGVAQADVTVIRVPLATSGIAFAFGAPATINVLQLHLAESGDLTTALEAL